MYFNTNILGYTAEVQGTGPNIPEVAATTTTPITTTSIVGGDYIVINIDGVNIATYNVPLILPSATVIRTGISNAINASPYNGSSVINPSLVPTGIIVTAPPNFGENYNGVILNIIKNTTTTATVSFQFLTGPSIGNSFYVNYE